ncbi:MAG: glycine cleavage system protein H [Gemmatimonadetes bacterium]|nr:glycine cleavage system protein H [Gemmatimonadota bacterium]
MVSNVPDSLRYTSEHEYLKQTDDPAIVEIGITDYAQGELGDIVFVSLPNVGDTFEEGDSFGTIEAVKAVSELYSPLGGEVEVRGEILRDWKGRGKEKLST